MKPILILTASAIALTACSARQMCEREATRDLRVINSLIAETEGNLSRGYAIEERQEVREESRRCTVRQPDGSNIVTICSDVDTVTVQTPKAIDLNAERAKLQSLQQRRDVMSPGVQGRLAQCRQLE